MTEKKKIEDLTEQMKKAVNEFGKMIEETTKIIEKNSKLETEVKELKEKQALSTHKLNAFYIL